jgi:hypothetical protein
MNKVFKKITGKDLIFYIPHRQTMPLVKNKKNKDKYIFIGWNRFFNFLYLKGKYRLGNNLLYLALSILNPKYIISINWITKKEQLFNLWCKKHSTSKFVVIQHGSYVGGIVTDIAHRYTHCDIFLTWGDYFTKIFENYNRGKNVQILTFGNPVYNSFFRDNFSYNIIKTGKILYTPTAIKKDSLNHVYDFIDKIKAINFHITLKEHNKQGREKLPEGNLKYPEISGVEKTTDDISSLLKGYEYDFIVSDKSTALLDAIFFKNKVIFFAPPEEIDDYMHNHYSKYLKNIYYDYHHLMNKNDINSYVDLDAQEKLLASMCFEGDNILSNTIAADSDS